MSPEKESGGGGSGGVFVDLWPASSVVGVLKLDPFGRILSVLEERTRPAGLLFGLPSRMLLGSALGELVSLPRGFTKAEDLLTTSAFKKSSMKTRSNETSVKVGQADRTATSVGRHQYALTVSKFCCTMVILYRTACDWPLADLPLSSVWLHAAGGACARLAGLTPGRQPAESGAAACWQVGTQRVRHHTPAGAHAACCDDAAEATCCPT
jgi:hypothetical protein